MAKELSGLRILLVHAHPDDETINNGATMAMYAAMGAQVTLVVCTRGEEGEVLVPGLSHLASSAEDALGAHREIELAAAMQALGISDYRFLGNGETKFRDSGMMGSEQNSRPDVFWQTNLDSAAQFLVEIIHEVRPHLLITYDENGGYGHPDHIQAHRVAMRAADLATEWKIEKIYWNGIPRTVIAKLIEDLKSVGESFFGAESADDLPFVKEDSLITAVVNGDEYVDRKLAAMRAHETQIAFDGPFFAHSTHRMWGREYYSLVRGVAAAPFDEEGRETELFAGINFQ